MISCFLLSPGRCQVADFYGMEFLYLFVPALLIGGHMLLSIDIEGVDDEKVLKTIKAVSQLSSQKKKGAPFESTPCATAQRENIPEILKVS